jgi:endonuclease YncB( thermonuclease family)
MRKFLLALFMLSVIWMSPASAGDIFHQFPIVQVYEIHDGDTLKCRFRLLDDVEAVKTVRVLGCDAFELRNPGGREALAFARAFIQETTQPLVLVTQGKYDNFGRLLADVQRSGVCLSDALTSAGLTTGRFRVQEDRHDQATSASLAGAVGKTPAPNTSTQARGAPPAGGAKKRKPQAAPRGN